MPPAYRIDKGHVPAASPKPKTGEIPSAKKWSFSFRFWRQINYFGVSQVENKWFVSLLERLKALGDVNIDDVLDDDNFKRSIRYHPINWSAKCIPISKSDIDWLGLYGQSADYELVQFSVSTGLGRLVGFFDESNIFQIVLLDPNHNLQPSKDYNYRVQATHIGECQISSLIVRFENIILSSAKIDQNIKSEFLFKIRSKYTEYLGSSIIVNISEPYVSKLHSLSATGILSTLGEIVEFAIDNLTESRASLGVSIGYKASQRRRRDLRSFPW
jgi:hypothetical protein